jgi:hypothetical protein
MDSWSGLGVNWASDLATCSMIGRNVVVTFVFSRSVSDIFLYSFSI